MYYLHVHAFMHTRAQNLPLYMQSCSMILEKSLGSPKITKLKDGVTIGDGDRVQESEHKSWFRQDVAYNTTLTCYASCRWVTLVLLCVNDTWQGTCRGMEECYSLE